MSKPHIVALGGTSRPESSTGRALARCLAIAEDAGARTTLLTGEAINFPPYELCDPVPDARVTHFVDVLRSADALVIGSPGYHGTLSGLVKNALDYVELLRGDARVYFDRMPVGMVATAGGWQAAVSTMSALRTVVHALRGWPTPLGVAINMGAPGDPLDDADPQLRMMVEQMLWFLQR
ncbi:NAD(P)H-dependent oxidoreductase [Sphingomonas sp.]|jgi:FMN reductase|uniref:NADPH-dependent FMN reductase n=1 Tax=Sphingomonas sp. TaxID=28214 RepID=UPI002E0E4E65|nr:NAD(P)H-dependent oxidoreductase [Sphingomonas sp.]